MRGTMYMNVDLSGMNGTATGGLREGHGRDKRLTLPLCDRMRITKFDSREGTGGFMQPTRMKKTHNLVSSTAHNGCNPPVPSRCHYPRGGDHLLMGATA